MESAIINNGFLHASYTTSRVLVTGGAGFIGSHVAEKLVALGAQVSILDNFSTGVAENISALSQAITIIHADVRNLADCCSATQGIETIFHLAAQTSVPASFEQPYDCYEANVGGTLSILEAARINGVRNLIFSSSAAVYGSHEGLCSEELPCHPTSPYGMSKYIGELLCRQYSNSYALRTACLRYFNVYGPRQRADLPHAGVIARMMHALTTGTPMTLHGDGLQERDFISVEKVAEANIIIGALLQATAWKGELFNISSGRALSIRAMLEALHATYPYYDLTTQVQYTPARRGDIQHSAGNNMKYQAALKLLT